MIRRVARGALPMLAIALLITTASVPADAGYVRGVGSSRYATLWDLPNNVSFTVKLLESLDGQEENQFQVIAVAGGTSATHDYVVRLTVSPDDPDGLAASWETNITSLGSVPEPDVITVPAETLPYRQNNVPFRLTLIAAGQAVDTVEFSMDLTYHPPPPDGGLFQLAAGTVAAWGLVLLYAVGLHRAHKRLLARADSLERAIGRSGREGEK